MTIFEAYNNTKKKLSAAGIEDSVFEAKQIIKHITGLSSTQILTRYNQNLSLFQKNNLTAVLRQREIRYPLQYIFGEWDFYGRSFYVGPGVLVPRADTELLIDEAKKYLKDKKEPEIIDLCAGSGAIGITLALEFPSSKVTMVEKFEPPIGYLKKNIERSKAQNTSVLKGDVLSGDGSKGEYDLIISNPPYIPQNEMSGISPETKFEPESALLAGDGGMEFYKAIINNYKGSLKVGGMLAFEVGINEHRRVSELLKSAGLEDVSIKKDLAGIERVVTAIKK